MAGEYPPVGFHFRVDFYFQGEQHPVDVGFQDVTGLSVEMETETYVSGGENRFTHQLPTRTKFPDLVLKRGLGPASSKVYQWVKSALETYKFEPVNLGVSLLNEKHEPLATWYVVNAYPKRWEVSNFNAEQNSVAIETITLAYQYFTQDRFF